MELIKQNAKLSYGVRRTALALAAGCLCSCANVSTTRFLFKDPGGAEVIVEMPKEVDAIDLKVFINATTGEATIEAKEWTSRNTETIKAQSDRESSMGEGIARGAAEGAMKGISPLP